MKRGEMDTFLSFFFLLPATSASLVRVSSSDISNEKARLLVQHFGDRVMLVFAWFFFNVEFKDDPDRESLDPLSIRGTSVLPNVHNACFIATLMAMRDINDFFTPREACRTAGRPTKITDLKASDLGLESNLSFLAEAERKRINQELIHSTHQAAYGDSDGRWDVGELTAKCISQSVHFLDWIQSNLPPVQYGAAVAAAHFYAERIREACNYVKKRLAKADLV